MEDKINIVGKDVGKISQEEFAKALGAEPVCRIEREAGGFDFEILRKTGEEKRRLEEIAENEVVDKTHLGRACGRDLGHCVYLGMKYCKEFDKARWYFFPKDVDEHLLELRKKQPESIGVDFYG